MRGPGIYRHNRHVRPRPYWALPSFCLVLVMASIAFWQGTSQLTRSITRHIGSRSLDGTAESTADRSFTRPAQPPQQPAADPPAPSPLPSTSGIRNQQYGLAFGGELGYRPKAEVQTYLDDIAAMGVGWIRFDMAWSEIQPKNAAVFDWSAMDIIVEAANARNLRMLPILAYTPQWARGPSCQTDDKCAPASADAFASFARAAVLRYSGRGIHHWEIWNEPNMQLFWKPAPNAAAFATLLKKTYPAIKAIDPSATIISGGLASTATEDGSIAQFDYLSALYAADAKGSFDALGYHPYSFPALPTQFEAWNAWSKMNATAPSIRSLMAQNGDTKPLWPTEFGAPTGGPHEQATLQEQKFDLIPDHVDEALQAAQITSAAEALSTAQWSGPLFWYSYKDLGTSQSSTENFYGLLRADGSRKPAYSALKRVLQQ